MDISDEDRAAIENILGLQCDAWDRGDAAAFGGDVAEEVLFTNILGMFSVGRGPFHSGGVVADATGARSVLRRPQTCLGL